MGNALKFFKKIIVTKNSKNNEMILGTRNFHRIQPAERFIFDLLKIFLQHFQEV